MASAWKLAQKHAARSAPSARSSSSAHAHASRYCLHEAGELEDVVAGNLSSSDMRGRAVFAVFLEFAVSAQLLPPSVVNPPWIDAPRMLEQDASRK